MLVRAQHERAKGIQMRGADSSGAIACEGPCRCTSHLDHEIQLADVVAQGQQVPQDRFRQVVWQVGHHLAASSAGLRAGLLSRGQKITWDFRFWSHTLT